MSIYSFNLKEIGYMNLNLWPCLTLSVPEKLKNAIIEIPFIPQTLIINNQRTTSAKSINLHIMRMLIEYSLSKVLVQVMFTLTVFEILLFQGRFVLAPALRGSGSQRVKSCRRKKQFQIKIQDFAHYKLSSRLRFRSSITKNERNKQTEAWNYLPDFASIKM